MRDLEAMIRRGGNQPVEVGERSEFGMHRHVPPFLRDPMA